MQNRSKIVPYVKVPGKGLTICLVDLDELSLCANWALLSPRYVHSYYSVLV